MGLRGSIAQLDLWAPAENIMTPTKSLNAAANPLLQESPMISESEKNKLPVIISSSLGSLIDFIDQHPGYHSP